MERGIWSPMALALGACATPIDVEPSIPLQIATTPHPDLVTAQQIDVTADRVVDLSVVCTSATDPDEAHVLHGTNAQAHTLRIVGLLADHRYLCTVHADDPAGRDRATGGVAFDTAPLPFAEDFPTVEVLQSEPGALDRYVLVNHAKVTGLHENRVVILDPQGRVRWYRGLPEASAGGIESEWEGDALLVGGGRGVAPQRVTLWGDVLYQMPPPFTGDAGEVYHHEAVVTADGGIVGLATRRTLRNGREFEGFSVAVFDPASGQQTFGYDSQDEGDAEALVPLEAEMWDPWHANAVLVVDDAEGQGFWVSLKRADRIVRIDAATARIDWWMGPGGDFALFDPDGEPLGDEDWFTGQHAPELDGDRLLVFDNGVRRADGTWTTRVAEYQVDPVARRATLVWTFSRPGWYEPFHGDADRLPNGNVLVSSGHCHFCEASGAEQGHSFILEVTPSNEILWELQLAWDDAIYRADTVHGCDLFANRRYCPDGDPIRARGSAPPR